jgi:two-component system chemotaxis sensor kinase CheA
MEARPKKRHLIDKFIPAEYLNNGYDLRRRSRLLIIFASWLVLFGLVYAVIYFFRYDVPSIAMLLLGACAIVASVPLTFLYLRSLIISSYQVLMTYYGVLLTITLSTGGFHGSAVFWLASVPAFATILNSIRHGMAWLGLCLLTGSGLYWAHRTGVEINNVIAPNLRMQATFIGFCGLNVLFPLLICVYESAKNRMLVEIDEAKRETERMRGIAEQAHANARLVLDSVSQGLILVGFDGRLGGEHSRAVEQWFGPPEPNTTIWKYIRRGDEEFANWLELAWIQLQSQVLPSEVALRQIPRQLYLRDPADPSELRYLEFELQLVHADRVHTDAQVLVVISDVTDGIKAEIAEKSRQEVLTVIENLTRNPYFANEVLEDIGLLVAKLVDERSSKEVEARLLHTLRGTSAQSGLVSISHYSQQLEQKLLDSKEPMSDQDRQGLEQRWQDLLAKIEPFTNPESRRRIQWTQAEYDQLVAAVNQDADKDELLATLEHLRREPLAERFRVLGEHAAQIARLYNKGDLVIAVHDHGVRLAEATWRPFWTNFVHAIRNAIDHGIEPVDQRHNRGKAPNGKLTFESFYDESSRLVISLADDGKGIDWQRIADRAQELGMPANSQEDLEELLFTDGFSSLEEATELSGRGVGMAALRQACHDLDGRIEVDTRPDQGTTLRFIFPDRQATHRVA